MGCIPPRNLGLLPESALAPPSVVGCPAVVGCLPGYGLVCLTSHTMLTVRTSVQESCWVCPLLAASGSCDGAGCFPLSLQPLSLAEGGGQRAVLLKMWVFSLLYCLAREILLN